jgi:hypothetical protein
MMMRAIATSSRMVYDGEMMMVASKVLLSPFIQMMKNREHQNER